MKNKMFTVSIISLLTVLLLIVGHRMYTSSTKSTSEVFTQLIYEDKYSQLDDKVLKRYKKDIYEELSLIKKNSTLLTRPLKKELIIFEIIGSFWFIIRYIHYLYNF